LKRVELLLRGERFDWLSHQFPSRGKPCCVLCAGANIDGAVHGAEHAECGIDRTLVIGLVLRTFQRFLSASFYFIRNNKLDLYVNKEEKKMSNM